MPDSGDFEKTSASASPASWAQAFAAIPGEAPASGGWERLQAHLPAAVLPRAQVRRRWPAWLAAAASLAIVVAIPLRMSTPTQTDAIALASEVSTASTPIPSVVSVAPDVATPIAVADSRAASIPVAGRNKPSRTPRIAPSQRPIRTAAQPVGTPRIADEDTSNGDELERLYAQSAQLESVLAMARDDQVTSATSAALSEGLDAEVAHIDAALMRPDLSHADQVAMWRLRVEALRALAGFEGTQRWLAAQGDRYDAELVIVD